MRPGRRRTCVAAGTLDESDVDSASDAIMGALSLPPSAVRDEFERLRRRSARRATDWLYAYSVANDYVKKEKLDAIVTRIYHGAGVVLTPAARKQAQQLTSLGFGRLPICMAKTQYSLSDDPEKLGRPEGFTVSVSKVKVSAGAGFIVVPTGDIMTMPGLPKVPAAERIDIDADGVITGLF